MKWALNMLTPLLIIASSTSCYVARFTFRDNVAQVPSNLYEDRWHHDGLFGLVEFSSPVELDGVCPYGVAGVEQRTSFINGFVSTLTRELYTPQTVTVDCVAAGHREVVLTPDGKASAYMPVPDQAPEPPTPPAPLPSPAVR